MAPTTWKFVDQPVASPSVLLDMNNGSTWKTLGGEFFKLPSPPLKRSIAQNAMSDGGIVSSAAYDLRTLDFTLELTGATEAARETQMDALKAQLAKPTNLLMYQSSLSANPVFFRTLRSDEYVLDREFIPGQAWRVECHLLAEPFAIGIRRDFASKVVLNDPANSSAALNSNTSFEVDTTGWTGIGGTLVRDTAQFHAGVASAKITPDGVTATVRIDSALVAVTGGMPYRAQAWVRNAVARTVNCNINWYDSGSTYISTSSGSVSVAANTWTFVATDMIAPANAAFASIIPTLTGTPAASDILWADEVELRAVPSGNATFFDLTGIVGDSPTPAFSRVVASGAAPTLFLAQRTTGNPANLVVYAPAETGTLGTDTTVQANDANMSGAGSNFVRTTFATASLTTRLTVTVPNGSNPAELRGRFRVLLKMRTSATGSNYSARYIQNPSGANSTNGPIITWDSASIVAGVIDLGIVEFPGPGAVPAAGLGYSGLAAAYAPQSLAIQVARNSGAVNLDMDYVYLLPADERSAQFRRTLTVANSYTVIDGPNEMAYAMPPSTTPFGSTRTVDSAGALTSYFGGFPMLVPGVTNRWYVLIGGQEATVTSTWDVSYWPRWREVATS